MTDKLRIGFVGCGGIAKGKHLPSLSRLKNVELVAFCDIVPERATECAAEYGTPDAKTYTDYGLPWFDLYDEELGDIAGSEKLAQVKTVREKDAERSGAANRTRVAHH